jgi:hypothetical protein
MPLCAIGPEQADALLAMGALTGRRGMLPENAINHALSVHTGSGNIHVHWNEYPCATDGECHLRALGLCAGGYFAASRH